MITIGADPELFIINTKTNTVVSSVGLIPGEKGNPYVSPDMPGHGFGLETDNILAEFNIPPCTTKTSFINSIEFMKDYIRRYVQRINPDYDILCAASKHVPADQLQSDQAKEFGCSVDYNVYTQRANPKPKGTATDLRSAGFHIHIGYNNPNPVASCRMIKIMDLILGLVSVLYDTDAERRSLYGKAGCFRLCSYGFEYRVLSSYMMSSVQLLNLVYDNICLLEPIYRDGIIDAIDWKVVEATINTGDKKVAMNLLKKYNIPYMLQ